MLKKLIYIFLCLFSYLKIFSYVDLFEDLEKISDINKKVNEEIFVYSNYLSQGGYFLMPSARSANEGVLGFTYSKVSPYQIYGVNFQYFNLIELSANYFLYEDIEEYISNKKGFGNRANRAANIKVNLLKNKRGSKALPDIALGLNDFLGSKEFKSFYVTITKQFLDLNSEVSFGWATGRMRGFYGAFLFSPFRNISEKFKHFSFAIEYDANNYKKNVSEHEKGRKYKHKINYGFLYNFANVLDLKISSLRGKKVAGSISFNYNLGRTKGLFPKKEEIDVKEKSSFISNEKEKELIIDIENAFQKNGFLLYDLVLCHEKEKKILYIKIANLIYREKNKIKDKILSAILAFSFQDIDEIIIADEVDGFISHEYIFQTKFLEKYLSSEISKYELFIVSPMNSYETILMKGVNRSLYHKNKKSWQLTGYPKVKTYFGNAKGKFKYDLGLLGAIDGYLFDEIYYNLTLSYVFMSSSSNIAAKDNMNPSKTYNVRSDIIRYYQKSKFHVEKCFLQKGFSFRNGFYSKLAIGLFEIAYGGIGFETLYYPLNKNFAVGIDLALLFKRKYFGLGFTDKVYKLRNDIPQKVPFIGFQGFLDFYYNVESISLNLKTSFGQFLAKDLGAKFYLEKFYKSGLSIGIWYTLTNGKDTVNRKRYFDKGISFSFPLDIFMNKSSKTRVGYNISEWLRDVGARVDVGKDLYKSLYYERH